MALAVAGVRTWRIGTGPADPDRRAVVVVVVAVVVVQVADLDAEALH